MVDPRLNFFYYFRGFLGKNRFHCFNGLYHLPAG